MKNKNPIKSLFICLFRLSLAPMAPTAPMALMTPVILVALMGLVACGEGSGSSASSEGNTIDESESISQQSGKNDNGCPLGFIPVSPLAGYTTDPFCVAKYEMTKDGAGNAVSKPSNRLYVDIIREDAISKCKEMGEGYDLITNDQWQTLARDIELVTSNWDGGKVGSLGGMNRGHSDIRPWNPIAASEDDNEACVRTGQTCDGSTWHIQRRTHVLSHGEVIWDLAGNSDEWVKDSNHTYYNGFFGARLYSARDDFPPHKGALSGGTTTTIRTLRGHYGPSGVYHHLYPDNNLGMGSASLRRNEGIRRGGSFSEGIGSGIFTMGLIHPKGRDLSLGFRCVYTHADLNF